MVALITSIVEITEGAKPQVGPMRTAPLRIEIRTTGGREFLEISLTAAEDLAEKLTNALDRRTS